MLRAKVANAKFLRPPRAILFTRLLFEVIFNDGLLDCLKTTFYSRLRNRNNLRE
jgi:hypothetical protein